MHLIGVHAVVQSLSILHIMIMNCFCIPFQADALAYGKNASQLKLEGVAEELIPHKTFTGNRPSLSIMLLELNAYSVGQLLAIYEHRVAVQGFVWGINSFDQWGVELGKVLANNVRETMRNTRTLNAKVDPKDGYNFSTTRLINKYLEGKSNLVYPEPRDVFPVDILRPKTP